MSRYLLSSGAQEDLVGIRDYQLQESGPRVARQLLIEFVEAFRLLARTPGAGHRRQDLAEERPILFWPMRGYLILYRSEARPLQIIAIVSGSQDVPRIIKQRKLI